MRLSILIPFVLTPTALDNWSIPWESVTIIRDGREADAATREPVKTASLFRLARATKPITATAVLMLDTLGLTIACFTGFLNTGLRSPTSAHTTLRFFSCLGRPGQWLFEFRPYTARANHGMPDQRTV